VTDFFISYNKADRTWAEWIAWQLEEAGFTTVLQAWDFRPGGNFVIEMDKATKEAGRTIAVLSPAYVDATFTRPEWAAAFAQDATGEKRTLVPVRVVDFHPTGLLAALVYVDLVDLDQDAARTALLDGIQSGRAKPTTAPPFPGRIPRAVPQQPEFPGAAPAVHSTAPAAWDRAAIRELIGAAFNSDDLRDFCFQYFPQAERNFTDGQIQNARIRELIGYADQRNQTDRLLAAIKRERPAKYAEHAARLRP
jgi:TIR domain/Effector-associated domain 7